MTRDIDDDAIAQLVRETAEGWTMPPVRLDAPSWRDRVRGPRARRAAATRGWFGRLGQAATAALALTVAAAFVAVLITRPPSVPGKTSAPSSGSTPGATQAAPAKPLPKLMVDGEFPDPTSIIVLADPGQHRIVDLGSGEVGGAASGAAYGSQFRLESDGSLLCLCVAELTWVGEHPTVASVSLARYAADGALISGTPIETFTGQPDPRDLDHVVPEQPPHVLTSLTFSFNGRYGYVGWSVRAHPSWKTGVIAVNLADGSIVDRLELPDLDTGQDEARRVVDAPKVVDPTATAGMLVVRSWYAWTPVTSQDATYSFGSEAFRATFAAGAWSTPTAIPSAAGCGEQIVRGGATADGLWLECSSSGSSQTVLRRLDGDGAVLGDTTVTGQAGIQGDMTALSPDGRFLFVWNSATGVLTRIDVSTGETAFGEGQTAATGDLGPLAALGDWLAPTTSAKSFLQGAVAVSPDGSKVYAIGVLAGASDREATGSSGVFVFDAATLASVDHWPPTADFVSLAVSANGRFVYAAGMPGVEASGRGNPRMQASITVFDTATGEQRLIAGELGNDLLLFESVILE